MDRNSDSLEVKLVELEGVVKSNHAATTERLSGIEAKLSENGDNTRDIRDRIDAFMGRQADLDAKLLVLASQVTRQERDIAETAKMAAEKDRELNDRINSMYKWLASLAVALAGSLAKIVYDMAMK